MFFSVSTRFEHQAPDERPIVTLPSTLSTKGGYRMFEPWVVHEENEYDRDKHDRPSTLSPSLDAITPRIRYAVLNKTERFSKPSTQQATDNSTDAIIALKTTEPPRKVPTIRFGKPTRNKESRIDNREPMSAASISAAMAAVRPVAPRPTMGSRHQLPFGHGAPSESPGPGYYDHEKAIDHLSPSAPLKHRRGAGVIAFSNKFTVPEVEWSPGPGHYEPEKCFDGLVKKSFNTQAFRCPDRTRGRTEVEVLPSPPTSTKPTRISQFPSPLHLSRESSALITKMIKRAASVSLLTEGASSLGAEQSIGRATEQELINVGRQCNLELNVSPKNLSTASSWNRKRLGSQKKELLQADVVPVGAVESGSPPAAEVANKLSKSEIKKILQQLNKLDIAISQPYNK